MGRKSATLAGPQSQAVKVPLVAWLLTFASIAFFVRAIFPARPASVPSIMSAGRMLVSVTPFDPEHPEVQLYKLRHGLYEVDVINFGAIIVKFLVPDKNGDVADVVLGFLELKPYLDGVAPYFGAVVGRVANRIGGAQFTLDGTTHKLAANNGPNTLHGGLKGFDKVLWKGEVVEAEEGPAVKLTYHSKDGEEGFPGDLDVSVTYTLAAGGVLRTEMEAIARNKATPVSLAQHTYWNLAGHDSGDILQHSVKINAARFTPVDDNLIPTGELKAVKGTPFDFLDFHTIGERIESVPAAPPGGYDHNYVLDGGSDGGLTHAVSVRDPSSGRGMDLYTSAPGVQFYTGNFLDGSFPAKSGTRYQKHAAFCLETQGFPNAINQPSFPSVVLRPGEVYRHVMVHKFTT